MRIICLLISIMGLFILTGAVSASTIDELQPASTVTYNEDLTVNGTGTFQSVRIGQQATGGVTFFNGTIINETKDYDGNDMPVTFGDNVRIDGELFRTEAGGDDPIKLADTIRPQTTATYDLGTTDNYFRNAYFSGTVTTAALNSETLTLTGDISQSRNMNGAIKALAYVDGSATGCDIERQYNSQGETITCTRNATGRYLVDFGFKVSDRFVQITSWADTNRAICQGRSSTATNDGVLVSNRDPASGFKDGDFMITVY